MSAQLSPQTNRSVAAVETGSSVHSISYFDRAGPSTPVVFLHGLGNAAANFDVMLAMPSLAPHRLIALDFPGCGASPYPANHHLGIDDLVAIVDAFVENLQLPKFLLVGASMGGLVGLLYAERRSERLVGFLNAEGNLAPEDCMFSRLVVPHAYQHFERIVFPEIKAALARKPGRGFVEHLKVLEMASPRAYYDFSFQTVSYSDDGRLVERFLQLPIAQHFAYGSANRGLTYLPLLRQSNCRLTEIENADHFMFYDAPRAFSECVATTASITSSLQI